MWLVLSVIVAFTSGASVIFQKRGLERPDVLHVSALCNIASFVAALIMVAINGSLWHIFELSHFSWMLAIISGVVQAFSWITFFIALKDADVNAMMALDKINIVTTMLLGWMLLGEPITAVMLIGTVLILVGSFWMGHIGLRDLFSLKRENLWVISAIVSPILMAVSNIIAKFDVPSADTYLTTTIRMFVIAVVTAMAALFEHKKVPWGGSNRKVTMYLILSGLLLGISYMLMYKALVLGTAAAVTTIVKGSIIVTTIFSHIFYQERLGKKGTVGFVMVCAGIVCFAF